MALCSAIKRGEVGWAVTAQRMAGQWAVGDEQLFSFASLVLGLTSLSLLFSFLLHIILLLLQLLFIKLFLTHEFPHFYLSNSLSPPPSH